MPTSILHKHSLTLQVDWDSEKECFDTFAKETSDFYSMKKDLFPEPQQKVNIIYILKRNITCTFGFITLLTKVFLSLESQFEGRSSGVLFMKCSKILH